MLKGNCHCGAVQFEVRKNLEWLTECNCSICRKLGVIWAHADENEITLYKSANATSSYVWGDKLIAFHSCNTCRCVTHWEEIDKQLSTRMAVNARLASRQDIEALPLRHFDGAESFEFLD